MLCFLKNQNSEKCKFSIFLHRKILYDFHLLRHRLSQDKEKIIN